jgi:hypothetical protein
MSIIAIIVIVLAIAIGTVAIWASVGDGGVGSVVFGFIVSVIVVGLVAWPVSLGYSNPRDLTCYVEDKDRAAKDGGSDMRIYTRECGVLKVQDLFWALRFDSADLFASIEPGHTYQFHVSGVRIPLFSVFPNVRSVERAS